MVSTDDYVESVVATAPALSGAQKAHLAVLFGYLPDAMPSAPSPENVGERRAAIEDAARVKRLIRALGGCGICGGRAEGHARGFHSFVPLNARQVRALVERLVP